MAGSADALKQQKASSTISRVVLGAGRGGGKGGGRGNGPSWSGERPVFACACCVWQVVMAAMAVRMLQSSRRPPQQSQGWSCGCDDEKHGKCNTGHKGGCMRRGLVLQGVI
jgi:hypothetical protein